MDVILGLCKMAAWQHDARALEVESNGAPSERRQPLPSGTNGRANAKSNAKSNAILNVAQQESGAGQDVSPAPLKSAVTKDATREPCAKSTPQSSTSKVLTTQSAAMHNSLHTQLSEDIPANRRAKINSALQHATAGHAISPAPLTHARFQTDMLVTCPGRGDAGDRRDYVLLTLEKVLMSKSTEQLSSNQWMACFRKGLAELVSSFAASATWNAGSHTKAAYEKSLFRSWLIWSGVLLKHAPVLTQFDNFENGIWFLFTRHTRQLTTQASSKVFAGLIRQHWGTMIETLHARLPQDAPVWATARQAMTQEHAFQPHTETRSKSSTAKLLPSPHTQVAKDADTQPDMHT